MLTHFPIGLLGAVCLWDVGFWLTHQPVFITLGYSYLALGLMLAVPTLVTGLVDLVLESKKSGEERERVVRLGLTHAFAMVSALAIFVLALILRHKARTATPDDLGLMVIATDGFGFLVLSCGGWFGGEILYGKKKL